MNVKVGSIDDVETLRGALENAQPFGKIVINHTWAPAGPEA